MQPPDLSKDDVAVLEAIDDRRFATKLVIFLALIVASAWLALSHSLGASVAGILSLGLLIAHGVELQHQCLHGTSFRRARSNRLWGIPLGLPMLTSYSEYQLDHMRHHRQLGTPEDLEFFRYDYRRLFTWKSILVHLSMWHHLRHVLTSMASAPFGVTRTDISRSRAQRVRIEYLLMILVIATTIGASVSFRSAIALKLWGLPFLVSLVCHALIELPEHYGCDRGVPRVVINTRTIDAGEFAIWFSNGNNYHVEHHLYPHIPIDALPALHAMIVDKIEVLESSYWHFYWTVFKSLFTGTFPLPSRGRNAEDEISPAEWSA